MVHQSARSPFKREPGVPPPWQPGPAAATDRGPHRAVIGAGVTVDTPIDIGRQRARDDWERVRVATALSASVWIRTVLATQSIGLRRVAFKRDLGLWTLECSNDNITCRQLISTWLLLVLVLVLALIGQNTGTSIANTIARQQQPVIT